VTYLGKIDLLHSIGSHIISNNEQEAQLLWRDPGDALRHAQRIVNKSDLKTLAIDE